MFLAYRVLTFFLYPFLVVFLYYRVFIKKEDSIRFKEKIYPKHFNIKKNSDLKLIWFHAASIGEFKSIIPIIKELQKRNLEILITTTTLTSGIYVNKEIEKFNNVQHRYFPLDIDFLIKRFLNSWKPEKIFLVDSEIWPNLILNIKKLRIPLALLNARLTEKSFKRWMKFPKTAEKIFGMFNLCLCSNNQTKDYLQNFKIKNVKFEGNIKLINDIDKLKLENLNEKILLKTKFWVAASIFKDEDLFCLNTHNILKKKLKNIITIVVPRHINRVKEIELLSKKFNFKTQVLNEKDKIKEGNEIIIINAFGILPSYYKYAKSVFIGKSLSKKLSFDSGQNPIDAVNLGCKVYHGPYVSNFEEIYKILNLNHLSKEIKSYEELSANLIIDLNENEKKNKIENNYVKNLGQTIFTKTMKLIDNFLDD